MEEKKSSNKVIIIVVVIILGGFFVLTCAGVLAAVAIPSFLKYERKSKASEAQMMTRQIASYAQMEFTEKCAWPPALAPTLEPADCCGGEKCLGTVAEPWKSNVPGLQDPAYFSYTATPNGDTFEVVAAADFSCGAPMHTVTVTVTGTRLGGGCSADVGISRVDNELE
jgi:type II secretory pathway pseudopilin PulG